MRKKPSFVNSIVRLGLSKSLTLSMFSTLMLLGMEKAQAQNVNIPDANFKSYLVGNTSINTNGDTEIQASEAQAFTGTINVSNKSIADLTGIEAFVNIKGLECYSNSLTSLDVSQNTALATLSCYSNQLTALDVSKNTGLATLYCYRNQLTALDVSQNTALAYLHCYNNSLTSLDVSQNTALIDLRCYSNQLKGLDVSKNTALTRLDCDNNQLTSLDVSKNTALTSLYCYSNQLTALDVSKNTTLTRLDCETNQLTSLDISKNTALTTLYCNRNQLTALDVSTNTALTTLSCYSNQLTSLNLKNGQNTKITSLNANNNPNLFCIQVDDANASRTGWSKPATASYNEDCNASVVDIPDANFKTALLNYSPKIDANNDGEVQVWEAKAMKGIIDVSNKNIADLTGIEAFENIVSLSCYGNQLTSLDLSKNTLLADLSCNQNQLTSLDLSQNTALIYLYCYSNQLTSLDLNQNTALTYIHCYNNQLTSLNVKNGQNSKITDLNAMVNINLFCIQVDDANASHTGWYKDATASYSENCNAVLPVNCEILKATTTNEGIALTWATKTEANSSHYQLYRSANGTAYSLLTTVKSANNANGSNYSYTDKTVEPALTYYYKLKQIDKDGTEQEVCEPVYATWKGLLNNNLVVYPNPVTEQINIKLNHYGNSKVQLKIFNSAGQLVYSNNYSTANIAVNVSSFAKGAYSVVLTSNKETLNAKFIK